MRKNKRDRHKCPVCEHDRFRTVEKNYIWRCRRCNNLLVYIADDDQKEREAAILAARQEYKERGAL